jgi:hypothetical protein
LPFVVMILCSALGARSQGPRRNALIAWKR